MHPLITTLRAHDFNLAAAAASLSDQQLLAAAADTTLRSHLESLLNLSRLCLTLQATIGRHTLLTNLASTTPESPAEQRRLADTLTRATDTRALGRPALRAGSAAQPPAEPPTPPTPSPLDASMPPASMPSSTSSPPPPPLRTACRPTPAAILRASTGATNTACARTTHPRPP